MQKKVQDTAQIGRRIFEPRNLLSSSTIVTLALSGLSVNLGSTGPPNRLPTKNSSNSTVLSSTIPTGMLRERSVFVNVSCPKFLT